MQVVKLIQGFKKESRSKVVYIDRSECVLQLEEVWCGSRKAFKFSTFRRSNQRGCLGLVNRLKVRKNEELA